MTRKVSVCLSSWTLSEIDPECANFVVLLANKKDISDRYWKTMPTLEEAKRYASGWEENNWLVLIYKCSGNY